MNPNSIPSEPSEAVYLSNVALSFGDTVRVLRNLNLSVAAGESVAMTGPSGAGKTSLLAIIAGLLRPTSGTVRALGRDLNTLNEDALAKLRCDSIGVVFQHFHLLETMTALENAALPLELQGRADAHEEAARALAAVGLSAREKHFPSQLSGGERQRVAIARAFSVRPKLLLADEPTGNLDYDTGREVLEILLGAASEHKSTLLFVTHNRDILQRFDSVYTLKSGALHKTDKTDAIEEINKIGDEAQRNFKTARRQPEDDFKAGEQDEARSASLGGGGESKRI